MKKDILLLALFLLYSQTVTAETECPPICEMFCFCGFKVDEKGCPICQCRDPCEEVECGKGMKCVLNKDQCTSEICCGAARCEKCPANCTILCKSGYRLDSDGCKMCECVDPCERAPCPAGMICRRKEVVCKKAPCYDVAQCECLQLKCKECEFGNKIDKNGCRTCECLKPCELKVSRFSWRSYKKK